MPTIADVATQLVVAGKPVLFPDTCILLDIIRSVKRRKRNYAAIAKKIHKGVTGTRSRYSLAVSHIVKHEWGANVTNVVGEAEKNLKEMDEYASHFHDACKIFKIKPGFSLANYNGQNLAVKLRDLSAELLNCGLEIDHDDVCSGKAMKRTMYGIPPAQKGSEAKDCNILEQYLAVCRELQAKGFKRKVVFCTSNTKDYCQGNSPHPNLQTDFTSVGLTFTSNLEWALNELITRK